MTNFLKRCVRAYCMGATAGILFLLVLLYSGAALATNCGTGTGTCFALTGNTNVGTSWSDTDGGANCNATCASGPAAGDACILTSNSGALTINASLSCSSFNACAITGTSAYASTLTHNTAVTLTVSSNDAGAPAGGIAFCLPTSTYSTASGRLVTFTAASGTATVTTNGNSIGAVTINGANPDVSLGGALAVLGTITLTDGTITANNNNISSSTFSSTNSNSRTLALGTGTYSITSATGTVWDTSTATNLSVSGVHTIELNATATARRVMNSGTLTLNAIHINNPATNEFPVVLSVGGATLTVSTVTMTNASALGLDLGTYNIATLNFTATAAEPGLLFGVQSRPTLGMTGTSTTDYVSPYNINRTGAGSLTMNNAIDIGNNSGITINAPAGGASVHCIGC